MLGIRAKRTRSRVRHAHFRQTRHQKQGDQTADGIADDYPWPCKTDGKLTAQKQTRAYRATDGNHAHLARGQLFVQTRFPSLYLLKITHCASPLLFSHVNNVYRPLALLL